MILKRLLFAILMIPVCFTSIILLIIEVVFLPILSFVVWLGTGKIHILSISNIFFEHADKYLNNKILKI